MLLILSAVWLMPSVCAARFVAELIICQHHRAILGTTSSSLCDVLVLQNFKCLLIHILYMFHLTAVF